MRVYIFYLRCTDKHRKQNGIKEVLKGNRGVSRRGLLRLPSKDGHLNGPDCELRAEVPKLQVSLPHLHFGRFGGKKLMGLLGAHLALEAAPTEAQVPAEELLKVHTEERQNQ
eukprot:2788488-Amphidinium_carterae.2